MKVERPLSLLVRLAAPLTVASSAGADGKGGINGPPTYDRNVAKTPALRLAELHQRLGPEINH